MPSSRFWRHRLAEVVGQHCQQPWWLGAAAPRRHQRVAEMPNCAGTPWLNATCHLNEDLSHHHHVEGPVRMRGSGRVVC
jgi:hypothetical protein